MNIIIKNIEIVSALYTNDIELLIKTIYECLSLWDDDFTMIEEVYIKIKNIKNNEQKLISLYLFLQIYIEYPCREIQNRTCILCEKDFMIQKSIAQSFILVCKYIENILHMENVILDRENIWSERNNYCVERVYEWRSFINFVFRIYNPIIVLVDNREDIIYPYPFLVL